MSVRSEDKIPRDLIWGDRYDVEAKDKHLIETKNINTSLTTFGKVVLALTTPGSYSYVPYRDSKLTRILQDSLGGNSKTFLVCTVSPMTDCYLETLSTLKFAKRAKNIQNKAVINQDFSKKAMLSSYEREIARLHRELIESREGWVSAGELDRVRGEKERAETEKQEVLQLLGRHKEKVDRAEVERESFEKKILELEQLVLKVRQLISNRGCLSRSSVGRGERQRLSRFASDSRDREGTGEREGSSVRGEKETGEGEAGVCAREGLFHESQNCSRWTDRL